MSVHPVTAALKSVQPVRGVLARVHRRDGSDVWIQVDAIPEVSPAGEPTLVVASIADVTHLFARSRLTSRGAGDHIVSEVVNQLADVHLETRAILVAVTSALSRMRPGTWVAELLDKDPRTSQTFAPNFEQPEIAEYINRWGAKLDRPGHGPTTGVSQRVIENAKPLLLKDMPLAKLIEMTGPEVQAYAAEHPLPVAVDKADLLAVPMRARGGIVGTLSIYELPGSNPLTEKDTLWMQAVAEGWPGRAINSRRIETVTALSAFSQFRRRSLFAREGFKAYGAVPLITRGKLLGALEVYHRSPLAPDQEWLSFLDALGSVAA